MNYLDIQKSACAKILGLLIGGLLPGAVLAGSQTRSSSFEYDPATGLLVKEIIEPNNPQLRLETSYVYDAFGNKTQATTSSPATGTAAIATRGSSTSYDGLGQFPVSSTNALNQAESKVFNASFGQMTSLTGPNGLSTAWEYDSFGRKVLEKRADGTQTKLTYSYCNPAPTGPISMYCPPLAVYVVETTPLDKNGVAMGSWVQTYYDQLNREVKTITPGFDGSSAIYRDTEYDNLGRVYRTSRPYYSNQTPQWTVIYYDAIGRIKDTVSPDNNHVIVDYNGLTNTVTNALGQTQKKTNDAVGHLAQVVDNANNSISYLYDAFDNLIQTSDPKGNLIQFHYDLRGRKTQMFDPDMGVWNYEYDALGALTKQTDAKNQAVSISYDVLGRMTRRAEPDLVSTWSYDSCDKGIGKLCVAAADNGYNRTISYDSLGRPSSTATSIDALYTSSVTYDPNNGRALTQSYPNGLVLKYGYTPLGYLSEIRNNSSNALYWQANTMDAEGHLLQQTYGNNVVTQQVYEASTGRLKNIYAGPGNVVQNFAFDYNALGNLNTRSDANQSLSESFLYDALNRLTSSSVNSAGAGLVTQTYAYNELGNVTARSGVGSYYYGVINNKPHALTQIALAAGGTLNYVYDANGNLTSEVQRDAGNNVIATKGRTETYTSFNMPLAMSAPGGTNLNFVYGPEHQRSKFIANSGTTIYLNPDQSGGLLFEKETKANGAVEYRNFITAAGQVIAVAKQTTVGGVPTVSYLHRDNMGSTTAVTSESGAVLERLAYEPYGKRRFAAGNTDTNNSVTGANTNRGYTNHEHLEALGLIHMNGRVYDPALGRFMSADPVIQATDNLQSYNRYSYVMNTPFMYTDPTGFSAWTDFRDKWVRPIAAIAVAYYLGPSFAGNWVFGSDVATTVVAGGISGAVSSGNAQGFFQGALSAGLFYGAGSVADSWSGNALSGTFERTVTHAVAGCVSAAASGGACGSGALSAGFAEGVGGNLPKLGLEADLVKHAVIGGVGSVLGGGKFANGAATGAFGYLFNYLQHGRDLTDPEGKKIVDNAATWKDTPYATAGTALAGEAAVQGVGADCSGSTCKIYDQVGDAYKYKSSGAFAAAAAREGFPFRQLSTNEALQAGDIILFNGHMAIYAGQATNGNDLMWTARGAGRPYIEMPVKYWGSKPVGYYRYQVPGGGH